MKRLIIALALLMPIEAMAGRSNMVLKEGKVLAAFQPQKNVDVIIMYHGDNVYRCRVQTESYSCKKMKEK